MSFLLTITKHAVLAISMNSLVDAPRRQRAGRIRNEWRCRWSGGRRRERNTKGGGKWGDEPEREGYQRADLSEPTTSSSSSMES